MIWNLSSDMFRKWQTSYFSDKIKADWGFEVHNALLFSPWKTPSIHTYQSVHGILQGFRANHLKLVSPWLPNLQVNLLTAIFLKDLKPNLEISISSEKKIAELKIH